MTTFSGYDYSYLTVLSLKSTSLTELPDLRGLECIEKLDVSSNSLTDLRGLAPVTSLTELCASDNSIRDTSSLPLLPLLHTLDLRRNQIDSIPALLNGLQADRLPLLRHLSIEGNAVAENRDTARRLSQALPHLSTLDGTSLMTPASAIPRLKSGSEAMSAPSNISIISPAVNLPASTAYRAGQVIDYPFAPERLSLSLSPASRSPHAPIAPVSLEIDEPPYWLDTLLPVASPTRSHIGAHPATPAPSAPFAPNDPIHAHSSAAIPFTSQVAATSQSSVGDHKATSVPQIALNSSAPIATDTVRSQAGGARGARAVARSDLPDVLGPVMNGSDAAQPPTATVSTAAPAVSTQSIAPGQTTQSVIAQASSSQDSTQQSHAGDAAAAVSAPPSPLPVPVDVVKDGALPVIATTAPVAAGANASGIVMTALVSAAPAASDSVTAVPITVSAVASPAAPQPAPTVAIKVPEAPATLSVSISAPMPTLHRPVSGHPQPPQRLPPPELHPGSTTASLLDDTEVTPPRPLNPSRHGQTRRHSVQSSTSVVSDKLPHLAALNRPRRRDRYRDRALAVRNTGDDQRMHGSMYQRHWDHGPHHAAVIESPYFSARFHAVGAPFAQHHQHHLIASSTSAPSSPYRPVQHVTTRSIASGDDIVLNSARDTAVQSTQTDSDHHALITSPVHLVTEPHSTSRSGDVAPATVARGLAASTGTVGVSSEGPHHVKEDAQNTEALHHQIKTLTQQLQAAQQIMDLHEATIAKLSKPGHGAASAQQADGMKIWRNKVLELVVQYKAQEALHQQEKQKMQLLLQQSQNQPTADPKAAGLPSAVATSVKRELIKVQQAVLGQLKHFADSIEEPLRTQAYRVEFAAKRVALISEFLPNEQRLRDASESRHLQARSASTKAQEANQRSEAVLKREIELLINERDAAIRRQRELEARFDDTSRRAEAQWRSDMETVTKQLEASRSESADLRAQVTEREQDLYSALEAGAILQEQLENAQIQQQMPAAREREALQRITALEKQVSNLKMDLEQARDAALYEQKEKSKYAVTVRHLERLLKREQARGTSR